MMDKLDSYVYMITALLPLAASMLVFQTNPYHALVIRGILGAVAALTYTMLGAADVALTEALVGTLLAITLYAVAVRSSMVFRLGVLKETIAESDAAIAAQDNFPDAVISPFPVLLENLKTIFGKYHLRVELVPFLDGEDLHHALIEKEVHAICLRSHSHPPAMPSLDPPSYETITRLRRLHEIMQTELAAMPVRLIDIQAPDFSQFKSKEGSP